MCNTQADAAIELSMNENLTGFVVEKYVKFHVVLPLEYTPLSILFHL